MDTRMRPLAETDAAITAWLHADGFDYVAETVVLAARRFVIVLHGPRLRWFDEGPRVLARLRHYGVSVECRFLDRAAMAG